VSFDAAEHYLFPWHGRDKKLDPSRPMTTWRSAWRSLRKAAGLDHVRFHDGRHTALTRLAEKGQPDWVIQAQMGHVSPAMMRTYSHIRRKALDEAAAALEPSFRLVFPRHRPQKPRPNERCDRLMSQFTSQWDDLKKAIRRSAKGFGSSGWTRTSNPPVNRLTQAGYLVDSSWPWLGLDHPGSRCSAADCSALVQPSACDRHSTLKATCRFTLRSRRPVVRPSTVST